MIELIKKHWITTLGILFLFSAFTYFLKIVFENDWFPTELRVLSGFGLGITLLFAGYNLYRKGSINTCQMLAGTGMSIVYATLSYLAFGAELNWPYNITFISVLSITGLTTFLSYRYNLRGLIFISIMGGLLSPIFMKAQSHHDMLLFAYVLILNVGALYVSISKRWTELRAMTFGITVLIYATYFVYFDPINWVRPFIYAASLFVTYMGGIIYASYRENDRFTGWNLYLSLINAMLFIFWSIYILGSFNITFTVPLLIVGTAFMTAAVFIYYLSDRKAFPSIIYTCLGLLLFAISAANIQPMSVYGLEYVVTTLLWLLVVTSTYSIGQFTKTYELIYVSYAAWLMLIIYWFTVAWDVQWIELFGIKYLPFFNAGALTWMALAAFGFYTSKKEAVNNSGLSTLMAITANIIVAGLFTIQIKNLWQAYDITFMSRSLAISISYIIYALLIFIWGAHTKAITFRVMGSVVLILTSCKVFFWDITGNASISKMIFLTIIGLLTLLIARINKHWIEKEKLEPGELSDNGDKLTQASNR
ncbi:DUF2339 domain-containing protein [Carboxylicivirga marina]|uniref:DUF2339 domain-containing protein n=1 Tax=Carboxylicivirga marina TaxID=2800988 RepID=A0ABS1HNC4_9BACT|nr:DUF2339 domain-containing protein [Carboxylicivirga marina]MBK3519182.1 DUF2339 domain-containing protein [Carboxylicivirga marina]